MVSDEVERKGKEVIHMNSKKILLFLMVLALSFVLMGCPKVTNQVPQFVQNVDGELVDINHIYYEHVKGAPFNPADMLQYMIDNQGLMAIDYDQTKFVIGRNRPYFDISDQIVVNSFYDVWSDGDDANGDGVVDSLDDEFYGTIKVDDEGNNLYDQMKILLVRSLNVGQEFSFTLSITDSEGASTELSGTISIIAAD